MKFSYNWIREFVDGFDTPAAALERLITMKTAECESIEAVGALLADACAARVESVTPIEGTHNVVAVVDAGRYGRKTVVCGAPNCRPGMITAYVPVGVKTVHGVASDGMLASGAELGVNKDTAGVLELDSQVGAPLPACTPDSVIEIDNKSITHRPDLWGHHGMAREVAAILGKSLGDPVKLDLIPQAPPVVTIEIPDLDLCPRYSALVFENVTVKPSPLWLQYRLTAIGLNPINNIVDLTNYILAELAQPMHAFDRDKLRGSTIWARPAKPGERIVALNDEAYDLAPANLVIADAGGPIAIGGVIGGLKSAISDATTSIVIESANFNAASIRKTSAALKLRTDASIRFEKSQDPLNTVRGLARAIELMAELSPGARLVGGLADRKRPIVAPPPITLPLDFVKRKLGREVPTGQVRAILQSLAFGVSDAGPAVFSVAVPSWRATKDVSMKDDLVEEVGRMIGYDTIEPAAPAILATVPPANEERAFHHDVRALFVAQGFAEVYNYSFVSEEAARAFGFEPAGLVTVGNPIANDQSLLRPSLLPEIWGNIRENAKHLDAFRLFEIGREIHQRPSGLPDEIEHLVAAIFSKDGDGRAGLFEMKRVAQCLMSEAQTRPVVARTYEHPARAAEVVWRDQTVGRLFELHPRLVEGRAALVDLDLRLIESLRPAAARYAPIRRYPASAFDLSVIAGVRELAGELQTRLSSFAGPMLESIDYVREYSGPPLAEGQKSVSFRLTVGSAQRTLSSAEVGEIRTAIIEGMRRLGYELRV